MGMTDDYNRSQRRIQYAQNAIAGDREQRAPYRILSDKDKAALEREVLYNMAVWN